MLQATSFLSTLALGPGNNQGILNGINAANAANSANLSEDSEINANSGTCVQDIPLSLRKINLDLNGGLKLNSGPEKQTSTVECHFFDAQTRATKTSAHLVCASKKGANKINSRLKFRGQPASDEYLQVMRSLFF